MLAIRFSTLLCVSFACAAGMAQASEPFVVQLRLPARDIAIDVFATRGSNGVEAPGSALAQMGMAVANTDDLIALASVPGLTFEELADEGAIVITCSVVCYMRQSVDLRGRIQEPEAANTPSSGGYLNYEGDVQWIEERGAAASGIVEASLFGEWGLLDASWLGRTEGTTITRLETTWTIDRPQHGIRARVGDSVFIGSTGTPIRFGGVQIGRYFGLTPSLITYPTPAINGEADSTSTVQLYVDGVLRAQSEVQAGPFVIDHAPVVSGGGEAELIITDILGRQQIITRPFFVSTAMLRPGLSDWSVALGAERRAFGVESNRYGDTFAAVRYRRGITDALTLEGAIEATDEIATVEAAFSVTDVRFGQAYASRAINDDGGFTSVSWYYDGGVVSLGAQIEQRDGAFVPFGRDSDDGFHRGVAGSLSLNLGDFGAASFTGAQTEFDGEPRARTMTLSYTPDFGDGIMSFRLIQSEREEKSFTAGVSLSFALSGDVSSHTSAEYDDSGMTYRASLQRAVEPDRFGWRARGSLGEVDRLEVAAMARGALGDTVGEVGVANGVAGARLRHAGSVGWIEDLTFAGRRIDGAFALVDGGAPNVSVARNRLDAGETGADGRRLVTNLQPYRSNAISISADDLPIDRAPASPVQHVTVAEGAGVLVRFTDAQERVVETHIAYANGETPPRGAVLVRSRDERRFPIGSNGRIVIQGARSGDVLMLGTCTARADETAVQSALTLECTAIS
jgi:outer membrane usher protein